jgi:hypothetical protein
VKALLVHPAGSDSFFDLRHALKFVGPGATTPLLGLLTVAALLPPDWTLRLADLNVKPLSDRDIE